MLVPVDWLVANPFRDFSRYPIDEEQVQTLLASIDGLSFWGGVTARQAAPKKFQIGGGHHRVEAYRRARDKNPKLSAQIEVCVDDYTDLQMAQIQAVENMTQRGGSAAAALDSIGGLYEVLAYAVLQGDQVSEISQTWKPTQEEMKQTRAALLSGRGLGAPTFLEVLPPHCMPEETIKIALRSLKDGGLDEPIMARVQTRIELENAAREAEEQRLAEAAAAAARKAEKQRQAAEAKAEADAAERKRQEEKRQYQEAERRAKLKEAAERKAAGEAEDKRRAEVRRQEEGRRKAEQAELQRLRDEEKARQQAEKEAQAKAEQESKAREQAAQAHKAAEAREKTLDPRVSAQLGWSNWQIRSWNKAVSSKAGLQYLPRRSHFDLAQAIDAKAKAGGYELTGQLIGIEVQTEIERALGIQRNITKQEKLEALRENARLKVYEQFRLMRRACGEFRTIGVKLAALQQEFIAKNLGPFPYDGDTWRVLRETKAAIDNLLKLEN